MKIIDCFIFYNEIEMLKYRFSILDPYVDYFILVESRHTHTGFEKPCFFEQNKDLFTNLYKIIHIIVDDFPHKYPNIDINKQQQWTNEHFQRNCIKKGLEKLLLDDSDILLISDLDEIPDPMLLSCIKNKQVEISIQALEQDMYYYNLNTKLLDKWYLAKAISYKKYKDLRISCQQIRMYNRQNKCDIIKKGGWHLSYFGDKYFIKNKIENFTHQEFNKEQYTDLDKIEKRIQSGLDVFGRKNTKIISIDISGNDYLPPNYDFFICL
jgi:beta-1,4-mannosyl-glycoprotein beta-1,4-N-acetylglucosaminyltransferase